MLGNFTQLREIPNCGDRGAGVSYQTMTAAGVVLTTGSAILSPACFFLDLANSQPLEFLRPRVPRPAIALLVPTRVNSAILATTVSKTVEYGDSTQCCTTEVR